MSEPFILSAFIGVFGSIQLGMAAALTLFFAVLGCISRGVTLSGAAAGALISFALYAGAGPGAFAVLVTVFAVTWLATRVGYRRKIALGTAERRSGRSALQVLANLAVAGACAAAYGWFAPKPAFILAMSAALCEAVADTVSSELGQVSSDTARLITNWSEVAAGTDGGITWFGTVAGACSAALIAAACLAFGLIPPRGVLTAAVAGTIGMLADSYMGAWFERSGKLNNDAVNFLGTVVAAALAFLLA
ncbi:MAG TPA: DUF92 domain-containing protein [Terriglobales bacterium]